MDLRSVDAIIFVLRDVILNMEYLRTILAFNELCEQNSTNIYEQEEQADLFDDFEHGRISASQFRNRLRALFSIDCDDAAIDHAWNAMLLDIPPAGIQLLEQLGKHKRLFLLSYTNSIHKLAFNSIFQSLEGHHQENIDALFERTYYSHELEKEDGSVPDMLQSVIDQNHLNPSRTLLIAKNISKNASTMPTTVVEMQTYHLGRDETLANLPWLQEICDDSQEKALG
jgi:putative hydrolase of the HAD superfamily